jgi:hypothetical protein
MPTNVKMMDVISLFRDKVLNDSAIEAYCQLKYSKSLSVFVGLMREFPIEENSPFVVFLPDNFSGGWQAEKFTWGFTIVASIINENYSDFQSNGAIEWEGLYEIDHLTKLVEDALKSLDDSYNIQADIVNYDMIDNDETFPMAMSSMMVVCDIDNVLGSTNIGLQ